MIWAVFLAAPLHGFGNELPGVNRPGIAWLSPDLASRDTVEKMAQQHVPAVRMMLVTPLEKSVDVIAYCNKNGVDVLLMVPLSLDIYYEPGIRPRIGNAHIYTVPRLSDLNVAKFETNWHRVLRRLEARNVSIKAIQIDNEFNSAVFNGDLPLTPGGAVVTTETRHNFFFWSGYVAGMKKLVEVLRVVSTSLKASASFKDVPVVLGGLARPTDTWIRNVDNSLVEPDLALKLLVDLGVDQYVDAYAIHLYPQVPRSQWSAPHAAIRDYVEKRLGEAIPVIRGKKQWWITEWGFAMNKDSKTNCAKTDPRLPLFRAFLDVVKNSKFAPQLGPSFVYDWDESKNFRIWDGKSVLCTGNFSSAFTN